MSKSRLVELVAVVRQAAKVRDPVAVAMIELLSAQSDDLKQRLVDADEGRMLAIQGAARAIQKLHRDLTVTPPQIPGVRNGQ